MPQCHAECDLEWTAALLSIGCGALSMGSLHGIREAVQHALDDALGPDDEPVSDHVRAMIVSGASNLPINVVRELL